MTSESKCPMKHAAGGGTSNKDWWPNRLPLEILHQHSSTRWARTSTTPRRSRAWTWPQ
jgi:catalase (peroxidase I)